MPSRRATNSTLALFAAATSMMVVAAPERASAQESLGGFALEQLDPAPAGDDLFGVPSAATPGHLETRAYLMYDHAFEPLVLGQGDAVVSSQGFLRADASLALFDRLLVSVDVPVAIVQSGNSPTVAGITLASPDGPGMGDVRVGLRARLFGAFRDPFQLALGTNLHVPTAGADVLSGEGSARVVPHVAMSGRVGGETTFFWAASGGLDMRGPENPHTLRWGGGLGLSFLEDVLQVSTEVFGATFLGGEPPLSEAVNIALPTSTSAELLGGAKVRVLDGLTFGVAGGPGLTDGLGTPSGRVLGLVGWAPIPARDRSGEDDDGDGVKNGVDACLETKGAFDDDPKQNGCPPPDRDGDRVPDALDACPSLVGRASADPARSGCPADYDRDGVADAEDACPNQKGVSSPEPKRNGCPGEADDDGDGIADREDACPRDKGSRNVEPSLHGCPTRDGDGDGIADREDACPNERGAPSADKTRNGCPRDVRVTTGEIVILRQVHFKVAQSSLDQTIDPLSDDLLTEVRDVILQHPEIEVIEVQGHADDKGTAQFNDTLSQRRADAVRRWLVVKGIDPKRLTAKGYGATRPISNNQTEEGRQENRRVNFVIIKKKAR